ISVANAANWVQNSSVESGDLNADPEQPQFWSGSEGTTWDSTVSRTGEHSLRMNVDGTSNSWSQAGTPVSNTYSGIPMPSGVTALAQFWARPDGTAHTSTVWSSITVRAFDSSIESINESSPTVTTTLPASSTDWVQTGPLLFHVPGDGQF